MGYAAVLAIGMLVTVIGLATLMAARLGLHATELESDAAQADAAARGGLELAVELINANASWRSTYTNDTWTPDYRCGGYPLATKVVDEVDGNLADDATDPLRVYARSTVGSATRIYSVLLSVDPGEDLNLLTNSDMEDGATDWTSRGNGTLYAESANPHGGKYNLRSAGGLLTAVGVYQDVTSQLQNNTTYYAEAWARGQLLSATKKVVLYVFTSSGSYTYSFSATWTNSSWNQMKGNLTTAWSGDLVSAYWGVESSLLSLLSGDIHVDDCQLIRGSTVAGAPTMYVERGTLRREVLP
ncbi:MAG TPA: carbohydrate binding domain-containing protein [Phycisphaerae bacterium]|nr:carbohydrate binding domain-containing protein [Phycisphaerae bacterium]